MEPTRVRHRNFEDVDSAEFEEFVSDAFRGIFTVIHSAHGDIVIGPEWPLSFAESEGVTGLIEEVQ